MKRLFVVLVLVTMVSLSTSSAVLANHGELPIRGCPNDSFHLHDIHDHDEDGDHRHIGSDIDRNGDGWLCVKHISPDKHLHIDNNVPFK